MTQTKLKTLYGVDIFVDSQSGKFEARIDGKDRSLKNLKALETEIRKAATGVQVIAITSHVYNSLPEVPSITKVIRVEHSRVGYGNTLIGPGEKRIWGDTYVYTPEHLAFLNQVFENYNSAKVLFEAQWCDEWSKAVDQLKPVDTDELANQLMQAEQN